jgi:pyridoxal phosphate-dependent aminotransferase EpsN
MKRIELSPPPCSTKAVAPFERAIAAATGTKYALATSSGTAAIHLALMVLGVGPGDIVLCPTFTFAATANPIVYCGAQPVFIDCDANWDIDADLVRWFLKDSPVKPKAVICVDLYGNCNGHRDLVRACREYGVPLIEDAAEGLGASWDGKPAGSFGTCGIVSFNLNKIVTAGGGGALVSDNPELIERARFLANQAKDAAPWYQHSEIGYNYRMASPVAQYGFEQIRKLRTLVKERRAINSWYRRYLPFSFFPLIGDGRALATCWLTTGWCENPQQVIDALAANGIEARRFWKPMHTQPVFRGHVNIGGLKAEEAFAHGICLPSRRVTPDQVENICNIIRKEIA